MTSLMTSLIRYASLPRRSAASGAARALSTTRSARRSAPRSTASSHAGSTRVPSAARRCQRRMDGWTRREGRRAEHGIRSSTIVLKAFDGVDETGRWTTHPPNDALWCSTSTRSSPFPQGGGDIPHTRDRGPCGTVSRTMLTDCKYRLSRTHFARRCSWLQESQSGECFCVSDNGS